MAAQPQVTTAQSEGTSVSTSAPDWASLRAFYASLSPILAQQQGDYLTPVDVRLLPHAHHRHMGGEYDIDTDLG